MVVVSIINFKPLTYDDYIFPLWANWVGWGVALSSMTLVPAYVVYKLLSTPGSLREVSSERALCVCVGGAAWEGASESLPLDVDARVRQTHHRVGQLVYPPGPEFPRLEPGDNHADLEESSAGCQTHERVGGVRDAVPAVTVHVTWATGCWCCSCCYLREKVTFSRPVL